MFGLVSRGSLQISIGGVLGSEATTLPTELTGARRDCGLSGCPGPGLRAATGGWAWAPSADLGRSVPPVQSFVPLNHPSPVTHHAHHALVPGYNAHCITYMRVFVPRRQLGRDRVPEPELSAGGEASDLGTGPQAAWLLSQKAWKLARPAPVAVGPGLRCLGTCPPRYPGTWARLGVLVLYVRHGI